ncbi:MAG: sensor domain-containing diguanylate cyclase [Methyloprofundus sp.]|nr:sensor domain-containing diguanylate cyclase [Methyloprofundus sp.]MDT8425449.1 sensor domain-containing diguanylate cyclase [Methyloprofundus sp.]
MEEDLTTDLLVLQSHLDGMLERVHSNSATLRRFQLFERGLLDLNSLAEMVEYVLNAQDFFDLDYIGFCLIDAKDELKKFLQEDGFELKENPQLIFLDDNEALQATFGGSNSPYLGKFKSPKCARFFAVNGQPPESVAVIPLVRRGQCLGALSMGSLMAARFTDTMATDFIEHMTSVVSVCLENHLNYEMMKRTSLIDTLTGVNNRRFLEQRLGEEIDRVQRSSEPLSCFFLDVDFFKQVNDTYGHQVGDQVLVAVANVIREQLRNNDVLARYGGEEFVALLANIDEAMALDIAERIRKKIKALVIETQNEVVSVTISIGSSTYKPAKKSHLSSAEIGADLIHKADDALYKAKNSGRDKVVSAGVISDHLALANLFKQI